jgi:hypothetical protein
MRLTSLLNKRSLDVSCINVKPFTQTYSSPEQERLGARNKVIDCWPKPSRKTRLSATGARIRAPGPPNPRTFDYQCDGATVEGLVGVEYPLRPAVSVFGDYKLSFATNDADLLGGGSSRPTCG